MKMLRCQMLASSFYLFILCYFARCIIFFQPSSLFVYLNKLLKIHDHWLILNKFYYSSILLGITVQKMLLVSIGHGCQLMGHTVQVDRKKGRGKDGAELVALVLPGLLLARVEWQ